MDVAKAVAEVKAGKIDFKVDKTGMYMQELVGFFWAEQIVDNAHEIIQTLIKLKPTAAKGCISKVSTLAL
jgi:large subunit ribosomal protein L1